MERILWGFKESTLANVFMGLVSSPAVEARCWTTMHRTAKGRVQTVLLPPALQRSAGATMYSMLLPNSICIQLWHHIGMVQWCTEPCLLISHA